MSTGTSMSASVRHALRWSTADIAVGAALGVACGVIEWGFDFVTAWLFPLMTALLPGMASLLHAVWYFSGPLGLLVIRKPGAAVYVNVVAVSVQNLLGNQFALGFIFVSAALQGLVAEIPFMIARYRRYNLPMTIASGALVAVEYGFWLLFLYYQGVSLFSPRGVIHMVCELVSGVVIAGVFSWFLFRAIAATGALDRFASGRSVRGTVG